MKPFLTALALTWALAFPAAVHAQDLPKQAVTGVIQNQLDAFGQDDFARAYTFASPMIKRMFGGPDTFGMMVQQGYPMVWRPADVTYGDTRAQGDAIFQKVIITDQAGRMHVLEYEMIAAPDGWQINGVQVLRQPQLGA
jgi:hypothetical protein